MKNTIYLISFSAIALTGGASAALVSGVQDFQSAPLDFRTGSGTGNNATGTSSSVISGLPVFESETETGLAGSNRFIDNIANISHSAFTGQFNLTGTSAPTHTLNLTNTSGFIYFDLGTYNGETSLEVMADLFERSTNGNYTIGVELHRRNGFTAAQETDVASTGTLLGDLDLAATSFGGVGNQPFQTVSNNIDLTALSLTTGDQLYLKFSNSEGATQAVIDNINVSAVPEPSSAALLGLGGLALILRRRK
ncbi:MAG: PEP-CTERM sorting domain-containing protein [Akkermansiaceae bacterium]